MTTTATELGQEAVELKQPEADDLQLWSVTTILGALDKPALKYWAAGEAADAAIDSLATWQAMLEDRGRDEAWKWVRDAFTRRPKTKLSAADLGTATHKVCETYALTGTRPDREFVTELVRKAGGTQVDLDHEVNTIGVMLNQFDGWLQRFTPSYQATEVCVYSPTYGYAGTCDAFMTIDGVRFIADYKTTRDAFDKKGQLKMPYPEVALQLSAYRHAEGAAVWRPRRFEKFFRRYYLLSAEERERAVPVPEVDAGLVIQISPESCDAYPVQCDEEIHNSFLYVEEAFRWTQVTSKTVLGEPLTCP